jgi:LPS sulfotransferase NodH
MEYTTGQFLRRLMTEAQHFSPILRPAGYFLLVSQERTGSTLLSTLLSSHPEILMDLHVFYTPETWPQTRRPGRRLPTTRPVRGFKFKTTHTPLKSSASEVRQFFRTQVDAGVRIVRLQRHNLMRQALSGQMVGKRNGLHTWRHEPAASSARPAVEVDVSDLMGRIKYFDRLTRFQDAALAGIPHLAVSYEDDLLPQDRHQATANRVFQSLDLPSAPVETQLRKLTANDLSSIVANLPEVEAALRDTPYARFLPTPVA